MVYVVPHIISFIHICADLFFKSYIGIKSYYFTILVTFLLLMKPSSGHTVVTDWKADEVQVPSLSNRDVSLKPITTVAKCEGNL
jgi:hypothetical protein